MESSSGASKSPPSQPGSGKASDDPGSPPEATAFGRTSKESTESTEKQMSPSGATAEAASALYSREAAVKKEYPDFSTLNDDSLISFYIAQFPVFPAVVVVEQKALIREKARLAQETLRQAESEQDLQKKQVLLDFFCEYKLVCMNECIHLYRMTDMKAALKAAQAHCQDALRQSPKFARGLMLFYLAESLVCRSDAGKSERLAAEQYMKQAAGCGIAQACWRLACNRMGYSIGLEVPEDLVEGLGYIRQMTTLRASSYRHPMQDEPMLCYYRRHTLLVNEVLPGQPGWRDELQTMDILRLMIQRKSTFLSRDDKRKFFNHTRGYLEPCAALLAQGLVIFERGHYDACYTKLAEVIRTVKTAEGLELEPNQRRILAQSHFLMGYSLYLLGDSAGRTKALEHFQEAASLGTHRALRYAAEWYFRGQQYEQASELYKQLSELELSADCSKESKAAMDMSVQCLVFLQEQNELLEEEEQEEPDIDVPDSAPVSGDTASAVVQVNSEPSDSEAPEDVPSEAAVKPVLTGSSKKKKKKRRRKKTTSEMHAPQPELQPVSPLAVPKSRPVPKGFYPQLSDIRTMISKMEFDEAEVLLEVALKQYRHSSKAKSLLLEQYTRLYINSWRSHEQVNLIARREKCTVQEAMNRLLLRSIPRAEQLVSVNLGISISVGDPTAKIKEVYEAQIQDPALPLFQRVRLRKMLNLIAHLRSNIKASTSIVAAGAARHFSTLYQLSDHADPSRAVRKERDKQQSHASLTMISAEEAERRRRLYKE